MEHSYFKDRISAYKDSGLNTEEQYLIKLHLEECAECRALLEKLETLDSMVERESNLPPDEYFEQLASRIDEKIAGDSAVVTDIAPRSRWSGLTWKITATAASVAVLIFIGYHKDDILPTTPFESPSSEAIRSLGTPDSAKTDRKDISEDRAPSIPSSLPKPSPASLNRPSAVEGYLSEEDIAGDVGAKGDVGAFSFSQGLQKVDKDEVQGKRQTIKQKASLVEARPAKETLFIRGGRTNEVSDTSQGVLTVMGSRKIIDKFKTNSTVSISQQEIEDETVDESDSNYKRARKSATTVDELLESEGIRTTGGTIFVVRKGRMREQYLKYRDSLLIVWPQFGRQSENKSDRGEQSELERRLSEIAEEKVFEAEFFDLLQNIIRVTEDSSETNSSIKIIAEMAEFGFDDMRLKAKLYLDSLDVARSKSDEKRK